MAKKKLTNKQALDKKMCEYKRILSQDEYWDWAYILRLLQYKLERTRKCTPGARSVPVEFRYTKETPTNSKQLHKEGLRLSRRAEEMQRRDLKKAFDLMLKNIWGWWD